MSEIRLEFYTREDKKINNKNFKGVSLLRDWFAIQNLVGIDMDYTTKKNLKKLKKDHKLKKAVLDEKTIEHFLKMAEFNSIKLKYIGGLDRIYFKVEDEEAIYILEDRKELYILTGSNKEELEREIRKNLRK